MNSRDWRSLRDSSRQSLISKKRSWLATLMLKLVMLNWSRKTKTATELQASKQNEILLQTI